MFKCLCAIHFEMPLKNLIVLFSFSFAHSSLGKVKLQACTVCMRVGVQSDGWIFRAPQM